jgi:Predicted phosphoribosyltransferases
MLDEPQPRSLVVDDLIDSGDTMRPYAEKGYHTDALFHKPHSPHVLAPTSVLVEGWIKFPWEHEAAPIDALVRLLQFCGRPNETLRSEADALLAALVRPHGRATLLGLLEISASDFDP